MGSITLLSDADEQNRGDDLHHHDQSKQQSGAMKGEIAWGGSLVGSTNPSNLGYRTKRSKPSDAIDNGEFKEDDLLPSSIVVQFRNRDGEKCGGTIDVPMGATSDQMGRLVHQLKEFVDGEDDCDDEHEANTKNGKKAEKRTTRVPYSFYAKVLRDGVEDDIEVSTTIEDFVRRYQISTENILSLTYQPLAIFRVRPVTRCTDTMPGHTDAILHVSYSPDSKHLASGGGDATVRFWDVNTSLPRHTCTGHKNHVLCTAWSPDGKRFASADKNGILILWDPLKGEQVGGIIKAHGKYITSMAWEPMHRNATCERLVTASKDGLAKIWNVRTKRCEVSMSGHVDSVESVRWGGEGLIYTASRDRTIKVWVGDTTEAGKLVRTLNGHGHRINSLAVSSDYICRTGPFDHTGKKFDGETEAFNAAVKKYKEFKAGDEPERLISGSDDFTLYLWHPTESKHPIKRLTGHQQLVNHIAFSPDGRYFASGSFDKKVKVWCGKSGSYLCTLTGHVGAVYQVSWSSDSRFLVSASKDSTAKLWEIPSGKRAKETLPGHADEVYALDWSPNGSSVATGSKDRTIKIWKH